MQTQDAPKDNGEENASMYLRKLLGLTLGMFSYYSTLCNICFQDFFIGGSKRNSMRDTLIKKSSWKTLGLVNIVTLLLKSLIHC